MRAAAVCIGLALGAPALAQNSAEPPRPLIDALQANGAALLKLDDRAGLSGWLVTPAGGNPYSLYVTADGHAVAGLLYTPNGTLLTAGQIEASKLRELERPAPRLLRDRSTQSQSSNIQVAAAPTATPANPGLFHETWAAVLAFDIGRTGPQTLVLADPTCPWSRHAVARLGRAAIDGRIRLRVAPIGVLGAAGVRAAAAIIGHDNMAAAWFARPAPAEVTPEAAQRVDWNNRHYEAWRQTAVPLIAWLTATGTVEMQTGDIPNMTAWLRRVAGSPPRE